MSVIGVSMSSTSSKDWADAQHTGSHRIDGLSRLPEGSPDNGLEAFGHFEKSLLILLLEEGVDAKDLFDLPRLVARKEPETTQVSWSLVRQVVALELIPEDIAHDLETIHRSLDAYALSPTEFGGLLRYAQVRQGPGCILLNKRLDC